MPDDRCEPKPLLVCGLHRSGTTFVGEILRQANICVVHEPLNQRFGIVGVPVAYPYVENQSGRHAGLIDDAFNQARPWNKRGQFADTGGFRRQVFAITGGRSGLRWGWLRLRKALGIPHRRICLKDPFMSLATPYILQNYGVKIVCLVRHPAAIHHSTGKQDWRFDIAELRRQADLVRRFRNELKEDDWRLAEESDAGSIALLWKLMIWINEPAACQSRQLLIVRHEDLCLRPELTVRSILRHFSIPMTESVGEFVVEKTSGDMVEGADGKVHDFVRDSKAIPFAWRNHVSKDDQSIISRVAGREIDRFYQDL